MNRLTHAFTAVAPTTSESAVTAQDISRDASPNRDPYGLMGSASEAGQSGFGSSGFLFDDPRTGGSEARSFEESGFSSWKGRPEVSNKKKWGRDRYVKANLVTTPMKRGGKQQAVAGQARMTSMAKGDNGRIAVGGGQCLRIIKVTTPSATSSPSETPLPSSRRGSKSESGNMLASGMGGAVVSEVVNLWKGGWAAGKGVKDIDWGIGLMENKLVTASPNGNFLMFDVTKGKLDREVMGGHPRSMVALKLCKVQSHSHLLITGGAEGQVRIWDIREPDHSSRRPFKHPHGITSLAFSPNDPHQFVVGLEGGSIMRHDYRSGSKPLGKLLAAHGSKSVMDLKWKEGADGDGADTRGGGWLASAGLDRMVQIWDMSQPWDKAVHPQPIHSLHTPHPLRRVSWRPGHDTELAVVSLMQPAAASGSGFILDGIDTSGSASADDDSRIEIWDVRREYVGKYVLAGGDGATVDLAWDDGLSLQALYQNGSFIQHDVRTRQLPLDNLPRQAISWDARGEVAFAMDKFQKGEIPFDDLKSEYTQNWDKLGKRLKAVGDATFEPLQAVACLTFPDYDEDAFEYLAKHYRLQGEDKAELCEWNAEVAEIADRPDDVRMWHMLQDILTDVELESAERTPEEEAEQPNLTFTSPTPNISPRGTAARLTTRDLRRPKSSSPLVRALQTDVSPSSLPQASVTLERADDLLFSSAMVEKEDGPVASSSFSVSPDPPSTRFKAFLPPVTPLSSSVPSRPLVISKSAQSLGNGNDVLSSRSLLTSSLAKVALSRKKKSESSSEDEVDFGDDDPGPYGTLGSLPAAKRKSRTPTTAPRSDTGSTSRPSPRLTPLTRESGGVTPDNHIPQLDLAQPDPPTGLSRAKDVLATPGERARWRKMKESVLMNLWSICADEGEVQIATALLAVGHPHLTFDMPRAERIVTAYVEILSRLRLMSCAAYTRKVSPVQSVAVLSRREGITTTYACQRCGKSTGTLEESTPDMQYWWCRRCRIAAQTCIVCHAPVKSLLMKCMDCGHGGHEECLRHFFFDTPLEMDMGGTASAIPSRGRTPSPGLAPDHASSHGSSSGWASVGQAERRRFNEGLAPDEVEISPRGFHLCPSGCGCKCWTVTGITGGYE